MLKFIILVLVPVALTLARSSTPRCSVNSHWTDATQRCQLTCQRSYDVYCESLIPIQRCICDDGLIWSQDDTSGACIDPTGCQSYCTANQTYTESGASCVRTCGNTNPTCEGQKKTTFVGCTCKDNYIVENIEVGNCILETECQS